MNPAGSLLEANSLASILAWTICFAVTIICVLHIAELYGRETRNRPALTAAVIIAAIFTVAILRSDIRAAVTAYLQSPGILIATLIISCILGWASLLTGRIRKYGPVLEVFLYALIIGLGLYARVAAPLQLEFCIAAFIVGAFIRIVQDTLSRPVPPEKRPAQRRDRAIARQHD
jgi:undecaprenyl pyrophosphate phosphatase UppP